METLSLTADPIRKNPISSPNLDRWSAHPSAAGVVVKEEDVKFRKKSTQAFLSSPTPSSKRAKVKLSSNSSSSNDNNNNSSNKNNNNTNNSNAKPKKDRKKKSSKKKSESSDDDDDEHDIVCNDTINAENDCDNESNSNSEKSSKSSQKKFKKKKKKPSALKKKKEKQEKEKQLQQQQQQEEEGPHQKSVKKSKRARTPPPPPLAISSDEQSSSTKKTSSSSFLTALTTASSADDGDGGGDHSVTTDARGNEQQQQQQPPAPLSPPTNSGTTPTRRKTTTRGGDKGGTTRTAAATTTDEAITLSPSLTVTGTRKKPTSPSPEDDDDVFDTEGSFSPPGRSTARKSAALAAIRDDDTGSLSNASVAMNTKSYATADTAARREKKDRDANNKSSGNASTAGASVGNKRGHKKRKQQQQNQKKKIRFSKNAMVLVVRNISSYTEQEKLDTWYSADEYATIEDDCELTALHMDEIEFETMEREAAAAAEGEHDAEKDETAGVKATTTTTLPEELCGRGLELWTTYGEELKEQQVELVIDTVWQAQSEAWELYGKHILTKKSKYDTDTKKDDNSNNDATPTTTTTTTTTFDNNKNKKGSYKQCWEFIRVKSAEASVPSLVRAQELASKDVKDIDSYLDPVRSVEQTRKRLTGIGAPKKRRSSNDDSSSAPSCGPTTGGSGRVPSKSILKVKTAEASVMATKPAANGAGRSNHDDDSVSVVSTGRSLRSRTTIFTRSTRQRSRNLSPCSRGSKASLLRKQRELAAAAAEGNQTKNPTATPKTSDKVVVPRKGTSSDNASVVSGNSCSPRKRVQYIPRSKSTIPVSPVRSLSGSLSKNSILDGSNENDPLRLMKLSLMNLSVASDESSTRRRMVRTAAPARKNRL